MNAEAQAPTREAALTLLLRQGQSSAANLAASLGISVQAMRRHLRSLEDDGLVEASPMPTGPGRPSNLWQLTQQGHSRFPDGSENFALGLLESLTETLSPEAFAALLGQQALTKANHYREQIGSGSIQHRLEKLVELRRREGYETEWQQSPDGSGWSINDFHCSLQRIAEEYPSVCEQELLLMRYTFPDCLVDRVNWRLECGHCCGFQIKPTPSRVMADQET
ncbi:MAG TPA: iron-sulfur cluster biosynthesis transcriptional regulator SufR [Prochlorococcaceae cyanobacterium Gl_MAG_24]|nr:iron-sulfur cluster biosynthesis transcriptional regulator SufR [Prochlorococcaceae cyanobacterium Gl_MAG_24]